MKALDVQCGGSHYKDNPIQPIEYIHANNLPYIEGNVIKYITRWRSKNGLNDLKKARHYIDLLIELEGLDGTGRQLQPIASYNDEPRPEDAIYDSQHHPTC